jgi:putative tryptophan/tyrosine transport system substrate-binding protein
MNVVTRQGSRVRKCVFGIALIAMLFALRTPAEAQPTNKTPRIGILEPGHNIQSLCKTSFLVALRNLGYEETKNVFLDFRYADTKPEQLPRLALELVQGKPDVIWTHSPPAVLAAKQATKTVPIVVGVARDLIEQGIVASLARPGGNITGMELRDSEVIGKRLELLKQAVPRASRVAVLVNLNDPSHAEIPAVLEPESRGLRIRLQYVEANRPEAFDKAFATIDQGRADALMLPESAMFAEKRETIFSRVLKRRLPTAAGGPHFAEDGALLSYGASVGDICQRSAVFVDKIIKGAKPADLPIERPAKFEFVINLRTAKRIGVTIPQWLLVKADRVIR